LIFSIQVAPHKEDLALLELAETAFTSTKGKVAAILDSSTAAAKEIQDSLAALSELLSGRSVQTPNPLDAASMKKGKNASKDAPTDAPGSARASGGEASTSGREESSAGSVRRSPELSVQLILKLDQIRRLMVPRARFLQCLKSDVPGGEIALGLDKCPEDPQPASPPVELLKKRAGSASKEHGKASPEVPKKGGKDSGKTTPSKGKKPGSRQSVSKGAEVPEAEEIETSTLAGQIKKALSDCRAKLGDACREYYEKLGDTRTPTRRARILEDAAAMAELHERTLGQLEWEGEEHRGAAVTRLRAQVGRETEGRASECG
jgi:hypothetical protein